MVNVTIIVPVFNSEKHLEKCLESLLNQTLENIEVICINDGSTDNSLEKITEYSKLDKRIKTISFMENKGVSYARNIAIENASGEFIGFVDSDDYVDIDFYEKLYKKAKDSNSEIVKGSLMCLKNGETDVSREAGYDINGLVRMNKGYFFHSFTSAIYNLDFIKSNKITFPNFSMFEDPYFSIHAALKCKKIEIVDSAKYFYVYNNFSATKTLGENQIEDVINSIENIIKLMEENDADDIFKNIVTTFLLRQLAGYFWTPRISTCTNKKIFDLFLEIYSSSKVKSELIAEGMKQQNAIIKSSILKMARSKMGKKIQV